MARKATDAEVAHATAKFRGSFVAIGLDCEGWPYISPVRAFLTPQAATAMRNPTTQNLDRWKADFTARLRACAARHGVELPPDPDPVVIHIRADTARFIRAADRATRLLRSLARRRREGVAS